MLVSNLGELICIDDKIGIVLWKNDYVRRSLNDTYNDYWLYYDKDGITWVITHSTGTYIHVPQDNRWYTSLTELMRANAYTADGISFVQVHPTFLYESVWNLILVGLMLAVTFRGAGAGKKTGPFGKRFDGQIFCMYLTGYGLGRFWIEGLRTDQLCFPGTGLAVSQLLSAVLFIAGTVGMAAGFRAGKKAGRETQCRLSAS